MTLSLTHDGLAVTVELVERDAYNGAILYRWRAEDADRTDTPHVIANSIVAVGTTPDLPRALRVVLRYLAGAHNGPPAGAENIPPAILADMLRLAGADVAAKIG